MTSLNLKYHFLISEDDCVDDKKPKIKLPDMERDIKNIAVDFDKSDRITVYPNEIKDIATTERHVTWDSSTGLEFTRPEENTTRLRLYYTDAGSAPRFRVNRNIGGDATTTIELVRQSDYVCRLRVVSGTAFNLSNVQLNDMIKFYSPNDFDMTVMPIQLTGNEYIVQSKGVDYIDFIDNGAAPDLAPTALDVAYETSFKVLSKGPVREGDVVEISGSDINPSNHGKYIITDVSDDYIEIINAYGVEQSFVLGAVNSIVVYENLIGFIHLRANASFQFRMGTQTEWIQLEKLGSEVLFMASASTHKIQAKNNGQEPVSVSIQYATVLGRTY